MSTHNEDSDVTGLDKHATVVCDGGCVSSDSIGDPFRGCDQPDIVDYSVDYLTRCLTEFATQRRHEWRDRARVRLAKAFLISSGYVKTTYPNDEFAVFRVDPLRTTLNTALQAVQDMHPP